MTPALSKRTYFVAFLALSFAFLPAQADAQTTTPIVTTTGSLTGASFSRDGIFGCNSSQFGGSPGTTAAIQGVYVPVYDAAVALNTGVLVYKECVLKSIAIRARENMTAATVQAGVVAFQKGRQTRDANGNLIENPLYPVDLDQDVLNEADRIVALRLKDGTLEGINAAYKENVKRAVARGYYNATRNRNSALTCDYPDLDAALLGNPKSVRDALEAFRKPGCSPVDAYLTAQQIIQADADRAVSNMIQRLDWSGGIYDKSRVDERGRVIVETPGRFVASSQEQLLQSGFRQQENADDIDEMVSGLFAGLSTEIIRSSKGLAGLTQPIGNQPSYLAQMTAAASQGLRTATNNAVIAILRDAQIVEKAYGDVMRSILDQMRSTQNAFRAAESACWTEIIKRVCAPGTLKSDGTCTAIAGACTTAADGTKNCPIGSEQLKVATSTIYSGAAIANSTAFNQLPTVEQNVTRSDNALKLFATLIESVNGTASQSTETQAKLQLDQLISQGLIHKQSDLNDAIASKKAIDSQIAQSGTYVRQVKELWAGDSGGTAGAIPWNGNSPPKAAADIQGWCNYTNEATISKWVAAWKK